jgi:hypothetical protein
MAEGGAVRVAPHTRKLHSLPAPPPPASTERLAWQAQMQGLLAGCGPAGAAGLAAAAAAAPLGALGLGGVRAYWDA